MGRLESQRLLVPMIVEMASGTRDALLGRAADLDRLGFVVEDFGGSALRVSAAPALLGAEDAASTLKALGVGCRQLSAAVIWQASSAVLVALLVVLLHPT
jgi:DNA mismatch repair ATPase MutL